MLLLQQTADAHTTYANFLLVKGLPVHAKALLMPHLQAIGKEYRI